VRVYAVGDVHGRLDLLRQLEEKILADADEAAAGRRLERIVVYMGDYVDRGPDSRGVIEAVLDLDGRCRTVCLRGNHEVMMEQAWEVLDASPHLRRQVAGGPRRGLARLLPRRDRELPPPVEEWAECGGWETLESYGGPEGLPPSHRAFLGTLLPYYETDTHIFVHANYEPDRPLDEQDDLVRYWLHLATYVPPPHESGKVAIVGHTPQRDHRILDLGHLVCIDTGCVKGGLLTAYDVHSGRAWQADPTGRVSEG